MASADVLPAASSWEGLKKEADTAFGKGHYAQAVTYYGQAIDLASKSKTDEPARAKLFANRALTYQRAGEHTYPLSPIQLRQDFSDAPVKCHRISFL